MPALQALRTLRRFRGSLIKLGENQYQFECSGRTFRGYGGVVGLSLDGEAYSPDSTYTGYDQKVGEYLEELSCEERDELADAMISLWTKWKCSNS